MTPDQQIDRSVLAGKDRDELHTIAGAIGVKAATRMRKADLIDAILNAANGGNDAGDANGAAAAPAPRRVRSARASQLPAYDPIAALAAEEDSLGADAGDAADAPMPRPRARRSSLSTTTGSTTEASTADDPPVVDDARVAAPADTADAPVAEPAPAPAPAP